MGTMPVFHPGSPLASGITHLFIVTLWVCAVIFALVTGLVVYIIIRYGCVTGFGTSSQASSCWRISRRCSLRRCVSGGVVLCTGGHLCSGLHSDSVFSLALLPCLGNTYWPR